MRIFTTPTCLGKKPCDNITKQQRHTAYKGIENNFANQPAIRLSNFTFNISIKNQPASSVIEAINKQQPGLKATCTIKTENDVIITIMVEGINIFDLNNLIKTSTGDKLELALNIQDNSIELRESQSVLFKMPSQMLPQCQDNLKVRHPLSRNKMPIFNFLLASDETPEIYINQEERPNQQNDLNNLSTNKSESNYTTEFAKKYFHLRPFGNQSREVETAKINITALQHDASQEFTSRYNMVKQNHLSWVLDISNYSKSLSTCSLLDDTHTEDVKREDTPYLRKGVFSNRVSPHISLNLPPLSSRCLVVSKRYGGNFMSRMSLLGLDIILKVAQGFSDPACKGAHMLRMQWTYENRNSESNTLDAEILEVSKRHVKKSFRSVILNTTTSVLSKGVAKL